MCAAGVKGTLVAGHAASDNFGLLLLLGCLMDCTEAVGMHR